MISRDEWRGTSHDRHRHGFRRSAGFRAVTPDETA